MKEADIIRRRLELLDEVAPYVGKYISHETVMKKYLQMTDEEIKQEDKLIKGEMNDPRFQDDEDEELEGDL